MHTCQVVFFHFISHRDILRASMWTNSILPDQIKLQNWRVRHMYCVHCASTNGEFVLVFFLLLIDCIRLKICKEQHCVGSFFISFVLYACVCAFCYMRCLLLYMCFYSKCVQSKSDFICSASRFMFQTLFNIRRYSTCVPMYLNDSFGKCEIKYANS